MPLRLPTTSTLRSRLPARTIRTRLTLVYGALFLGSGAALLVITSVLWSRSTSGARNVSFAGVSARILRITHPPGNRHIALPPANFVSVAGEQSRKVRSQLLSLVNAQQSADLHQLLVWSGIALAITAILALLLGWLIAGRVLRPIRILTAATQEISATNLHERLDLAGPDDELKRLGNTIDKLLGRLELSFEAQRLFVANASHELRTPLATMRTALDITRAKPDAIPPQTKMLADHLERELDHVDALVESFLTLARAEHGRPEEMLATSLGQLVENALAARTALVEELALVVENTCDPAAIVSGDATLLARMVANLIDNAISHNVRGGNLRLGASVNGGNARLLVENDGPVLDPGDVGQLIEPFRRVGVARTRSADGLGLGLSIVAAIVGTHGGRLELEARAEGGLRAIVELPLDAQELSDSLP